MKRAILVMAVAGLSACASSPGEDGDRIVLHARVRDAGTGESAERRLSWDPGRSAVVIVDMWDDHWCKGAARRVAEMAGPMDAVVRAARARGVLIVHAPSSVADFYRGSPARRRAKEAPRSVPPAPLSTAVRWGTNWVWPDEAREGLLPVDDSDMGCDCDPACAIREAWTRQIATIGIDEAADAITDDGQELWNLLAGRGVRHVLVMGVHLNMCVLGRATAIRQLVRLEVVLLRDLTDTMYNSRMKPFVDHHSGTDLVVAHVERYWCPTATSVDLGAPRPFRFADDPRKDRPR
jgi:nicotinamidase-related amidase